MCFHCQQAAEKLLKAYLVSNGQLPPFSHDLLLLLERVLPLNPGAEHLRNALALLMPYAVEIRYPDDWFAPSLEDAAEARESAARVLQWLQAALPELFEEVQPDGETHSLTLRTTPPAPSPYQGEGVFDAEAFIPLSLIRRGGRGVVLRNVSEEKQCSQCGERY